MRIREGERDLRGKARGGREGILQGDAYAESPHGADRNAYIDVISTRGGFASRQGECRSLGRSLKRRTPTRRRRPGLPIAPTIQRKAIPRGVIELKTP